MNKRYTSDMTDILNLLAYRIADDAARSDIECHCAARMEHGGEPQRTEDYAECWYDSFDVADPEMRNAVETALLYLSARGMVRWHKKHRGWVRVLGEEAVSIKISLH